MPYCFRVTHFSLGHQSELFGICLNRTVYMCIKMLVFWYSNQLAHVRWCNSISSSFYVSNGTKHGGVLSPYLFSYYIRDVISAIVNCGLGCYIGEYCMNLVVYADDMVLLSPS